MNNFFYDDSEFSLFKKALRSTRNEPVVINILSSDSSLKGNEQTDENKSMARKNMSNKFEPTTPFGKFFGPRKPRTAPVDMKDFSSWKNKNYRKVEESLNDRPDSAVKFSIADFMKEKSGKEKYHGIDQIKSETQKPITQLASSDPTYKKFYLDSYLNKLEQQSKTKNKFEENDDLLEPLGDRTQNVVPDSSQDENFLYSSKVDVEDFALEDDLYGEKYKIEQSELERVKSRLEKLEQEERIRDKSNEKIISGNELSSIAEGNERRDEDKLVDDIEKLNERLKKVESMQSEKFEEDVEKESTSKVEDKTAEINEDENVDDNTETYDDGVDEESASNDDNGLEFNESENVDIEKTDDEKASEDESYLNSQNEKINREDILTKEDFKAMSDELINKFTEMYKKEESSDMPNNLNETGYMTDMYYNPNDVYVDGYNQMAYDQVGVINHNDELNQFVNEENEKRQAEMQAKLDELIEKNKKADERIEESLRQAELEKQKVAEEYESKIKELEESYKQHVEDMKKQSYLEKIDRDAKLQEVQSNFKRREKEIKDLQKASSDKQNAGAMLRRELKSNLNISNLEMDKKLLELSSQNKNAYLSNSQLTEIDEDAIKNAVNETGSSKKSSKSAKNVDVQKTPAKRRRKKSNRRRIDSDIIGSIDFE